MSNCFKFDRNPGFLFTKLKSEQLKPFWQEVNEIQKNFNDAQTNGDYLAGNLEHQYQLSCRDYALKLVEPFVAEYIKTFDYGYRLQHIASPSTLTIAQRDLWVNFQKKHEFNPPHYHSGLFSFVIWLQVPFTWKDELAAGPGRNTQEPQNGDFMFQYTDVLGTTKVQRLGIDKSKEGYFCLFPAGLTHYVNPFYSSDDYRITVSGNLKYAV